MKLSDATFLLFLYLKLVGEISWSWRWITCPFWSGVLISVVYDKYKERKNKNE